MDELGERVEAARERVRDELAAAQLSPAVARIYGQHVRLRAGQPVLGSFTRTEFLQRLADATRLVDASLPSGDVAGSARGLRRAGELLEWIAHPELNDEGLPLTLLSAACYHLAGYPARAASVARTAPEEQDAPLLRLALRGSFHQLLPLATDLAASEPVHEEVPEEIAEDPSVRLALQIHEFVGRELAAAVAVLCADLRWAGAHRRRDAALAKLSAAAPALLHAADAYSWLVVQLTAAVFEMALARSLRGAMSELEGRLDERGRRVLERYIRLAFTRDESLVWPSQERGLERLADGGSFALCTPTGSGKTRVAEIALIAGLFAAPEEVADPEQGPPLALYVVPTRALAAEIEAKMSRVLRAAGGSRAVTVTGLYGGADWGPADAWLENEQPTLLICTPEKAEALVRFLGALLLRRVRMVIVDEAHEVQDDGDDDQLARHESRSLRLETLVARLRATLPAARFIAISAVAHELEGPLARWISGDDEAMAVSSDYRSTRQLVGRLHCGNRRTRIVYDLLDRHPLRVERDGVATTPFVPQPFPPHPPAPDFTGPQKGMAPYALWSALQLAAAGTGPRSQRPAVLISVTEQIANFAGWCDTLLTSAWADAELPRFFVLPRDGSRRRGLYDRALLACEDYFGTDSREYRLLERGVVVHHGRMPGRLPRLLVELVERRIVRIVVATSTLTQGVNLPFETILVPSLRRRSGGEFTAHEFGNLIGRAGRPGLATEGQALVLLRDGLAGWQARDVRGAYVRLVRQLSGAGAAPAASSSLARLIELVRTRAGGSDDDVADWLEATAPRELAPEDSADAALDSLDALLLASLEEGAELDVEARLRALWRETFAYRASAEEARLGALFVCRGRALHDRIYADPGTRRRYYRTGLPPTEAHRMIELSPRVVEHLHTGEDYESWNNAARYAYVERTIELVSELPRFAVRERVGARGAAWREVLRWWLRHPDRTRTPTVAQRGPWHEFVAREFGYRFAWGLGAVLATIADEIPGGQNPERWIAANVPPAALWIKELLQWGTLDPVAAYLLARGQAHYRAEAEALGETFYATLPNLLKLGVRPLDPATVREWATALAEQQDPQPTARIVRRYDVELVERISGPAAERRWRVLPLVRAGRIDWADPAGVVLATSERPLSWREDAELRWDFVLEPARRSVVRRPYL